MKTKLEELRAAYEAATPGEWEPANRWRDGQYGLRLLDNTDYFDAAELSINEDVGNADFIAQAHNLMPQLLEAVRWADATLSWVDACFPEYTDVEVCNELRAVLESLK